MATAPLDTDVAQRFAGILQETASGPLLVRLDLEDPDPLLVALESVELLTAERFEADFHRGPVVAFELTDRGRALLSALGA